MVKHTKQRPLIAVYISSESNMDQLDEIKELIDLTEKEKPIQVIKL